MRAFTLIELLVVVAILVVLLALLTPALDQAIYRAELAVCGTRLRNIATGAIGYALHFQRSYPYRPGVASGATWYPHQLSNGGAHGDGSADFDERPHLAGFVEMVQYADPLCRKVDLSVDGNPRDVWYFSSYAVWYGWRYAGEAGMSRMGQSVTWEDDRETPALRQHHRWLATDFDAVTPPAANVQGSHPDGDGLMVNRHKQTDGQDGSNPVIIANNQIARVTYSFWDSIEGGFARGVIEMNAAGDDGHVAFFRDVNFENDPSVIRAYSDTNRSNNLGNQSWINVPRP